MVAGMWRQPPVVPAGTAVPAVPGLEDERALRSPSGSAGSFS
ncbi:MAG: hypothetical protein ACOYD3_07285 [Kiritimatiellia bacterium]